MPLMLHPAPPRLHAISYIASHKCAAEMALCRSRRQRTLPAAVTQENRKAEYGSL